MPRARRPALHSAETSFRGKGAAACLCRPRPFQVGVFSACCFPSRVEPPSFPPCRGRGGQGEASRGSSRSVASLAPLCPRRNGEERIAPCPERTYASSAAGTRLVWHLGTTTRIPWAMAAPRHRGRGTPVSPAAGPRVRGSLALRQRRTIATPASLRGRLTRDVSHVCWVARPCAGAPGHAGVVAWVASGLGRLSTKTGAEASPCGALWATRVRRVASVVGASRPRHRRADALACAMCGQTVYPWPLSSPRWYGSAPTLVRLAEASPGKREVRSMTFVIAEPCMDVMDQACVRVCPVACIHWDAGKARKLSIDPQECIDCGSPRSIRW